MSTSNIQIIDGYNGGKPHIEAAMIRDHNISLYGTGDYVLNVGNKFAHEIVNNNNITIKDGMAVIGGARCILGYGKTMNVVIENGTSGYKRHDIIVLEYSLDNATLIETVSIKVVKGEIGATGKDPALVTGDIRAGSTLHQMPLKRVKIDGLSIIAVEDLWKPADLLNTERNNLFELRPSNSIPQNADLNSYTDFGNYTCPSAAVAKTLKNSPITNHGFSLRVMRGTSGIYCVQEIVNFEGNRLFRNYTGTGFTAWKGNLQGSVLSDLEGLQMVKVWENSSAGSAFAPQKITLNLKDYTGAFVVCATSTTGLTMVKGNYCGMNQSTYILTQIFNFRGRKVTVDVTGVTFDKGDQFYANGTSAGGNGDNVVIPLTIYGVKF